jgi:hypothetical protein
MAFRFEFDPAHRILGIRFWDRVTEDDLSYFYRMSALLVGSLDPASAVIDFSDVTSFDSSAQFMKRLAALPPAMPRAERPRIVVAPQDEVFGLARLFEMAGEATRPNFHVVRSTREAWAILGVEEPRFKAIPEALESRDEPSGC